MELKPLHILNARLIDGDAPRPGSLLAMDGRIAAIDPTEVPEGIEAVDAKGQWLAPGIIDLGVFATDKPAFHFGGITRAALMPDGSSPLDDPGLIERAAKAAAESYPPYNVEDRGEGALRITLAVAGFTPDQLAVTVEDRQLIVAGKREGAADEAYLHRGIAARGFVRTFILADGMKVEGAILAHGLLHIDLARPEPERLVQRIPIKTAG